VNVARQAAPVRWTVLLVAFALSLPAIAFAPHGGDGVPVDAPGTDESAVRPPTGALSVPPRPRGPSARAAAPVDEVPLPAVASVGSTSAVAAGPPCDVPGAVVPAPENWLAAIDLIPPRFRLADVSGEMALGTTTFEAPRRDPRGRSISLRVESWTRPDRRGERALEATVDLDVADDGLFGAHVGRRRAYVRDYDLEVGDSIPILFGDPILDEAVDGLCVVAAWDALDGRDALSIAADWVVGQLVPRTVTSSLATATVVEREETRDGVRARIGLDGAAFDLPSGRRVAVTTCPTPPAERARSRATSGGRIDVWPPGEVHPRTTSLATACASSNASDRDPWPSPERWIQLADGMRIRARTASSVDEFDVLLDAWDPDALSRSWHAHPGSADAGTRVAGAPATRTTLHVRVPLGRSVTRDVVLDVGCGPERWTVCVTR
jgi:hypothetical protein